MEIRKIENPRFLKQLNIDELNQLSQDIRDFLIENISKTGGHFSSNLGIVELTVALHYVFDSPKDKFLFDVGHQAYVHKILTGRAPMFNKLKKYGGMCGFQNRHESIHDPWEAGHSSTTISGATGLAIARDLKKENFEVISIIGDAALMSGESLEALNFLGGIDTKVIVILNDNNMSISRNVGGLSNFLSDVRMSYKYNQAKSNYTEILSQSAFGQKIFDVTKRVKDKVKRKILLDTPFSQFDLDYIGPVDGHNIEELIRALETVKNLDHSVVLHVLTKKGKGYEPAEKDRSGVYHSVGAFDIVKGIQPVLDKEKHSWSQSVSDHVEYLMNKHDDICVITPAMITGSCLQKIFKNYPDRSFDVGIAEEHAMTLAAGLSQGKEFPFLSVYSSFFQRAYDQLNHDIARMNLPCLIGIDRAGLVGGDGATHHGVFDIGLIAPIPGVIIMAPKDEEEAQKMINTAYQNKDHPYVMRYSKNKVIDTHQHTDETIKVGQWELIKEMEDAAINVVTYGDNVLAVLKMAETDHLPINIINARFIKPIDKDMLKRMSDKPIIVYETDLMNGSLGSIMSLYYEKNHINVDMSFIGIDDHYVTFGDNESLYKQEHISLNDLKNKIEEIEHEKRKN
ncbi:1-deoxy-D-xylulose-5-phosphate synthase [uncultured Catenibacterium sp.]|uniref:1-deoxy-D-xylulose-5-phosphate synthase n=1 Tax=uncultured Catenibacterium sp. TaxID=286142 RepID=UPI002594ADE6|nr:1-deoxy-D-xylulose-5-phosphate synthase [uncultured Catenibacterium sp.]